MAPLVPSILIAAMLPFATMAIAIQQLCPVCDTIDGPCPPCTLSTVRPPTLPTAPPTVAPTKPPLTVRPINPCIDSVCLLKCPIMATELARRKRQTVVEQKAIATQCGCTILCPPVDPITLPPKNTTTTTTTPKPIVTLKTTTPRIIIDPCPQIYCIQSVCAYTARRRRQIAETQVMKAYQCGGCGGTCGYPYPLY